MKAIKSDSDSDVVNTVLEISCVRRFSESAVKYIFYDASKRTSWLNRCFAFYYWRLQAFVLFTDRIPNHCTPGTPGAPGTCHQHAGCNSVTPQGCACNPASRSRCQCKQGYSGDGLTCAGELFQRR